MMKRKFTLPTILLSLCFGAFAQNAYEIKFNIKGLPDDTLYLTNYLFGKQYVVDTCLNVKNGIAVFKGKTDLNKGVYTLISERKSIYFDFFVNENQKFTVTSDMKNVIANLKATGSKENEDFFSYIKYISAKNIDFNTQRESTKGLSKADSTKLVNEGLKTLNEDITTFEKAFMLKQKGTFVYDVLNLRTEKYADAAIIPKAKNNRPDSVWQFYYYKNHYWDDVNFKDTRLVRTPSYFDRLTKYFDNYIVQHPDTISTEIDKLMNKCEKGNDLYIYTLSHFTSKYQDSKIMGFDKIFVHMYDTYIKTGRASDLYTEETIKKIGDRIEIIRNVQIGAKAPELFMIDTINGKTVSKMGFDTCKSSESVTKLYYKNVDKLTPMFHKLSDIKSKYTVLVFWDVDCGHCQTEIPKLNDNLKPLKGKIDFTVYAVYTKEEYSKWINWLKEKKVDFFNVYDPVHINNLKDKYDIYSTPVIYILDKDKIIKAKRLGADQVKDYIEMLEKIEKESLKK
jgi:thiol-disulfide isomerase/thioredoxin